MFDIHPGLPAGVAHLLHQGHHFNKLSMAKSQATFMKKQLEKNRLKKKEDKQERKQERKQNGGSDMELAYVNEFGEIVSTPPEGHRAAL